MTVRFTEIEVREKVRSAHESTGHGKKWEPRSPQMVKATEPKPAGRRGD